MSLQKHIPFDAWPTADRNALAGSYLPGDIFDGGGGKGSHLSAGTRIYIETMYGRWLGFLQAHDAAAVRLTPGERITQQRVRTYVNHLSLHVRMSSVYSYIHGLLLAAGLMDPDQDWKWLRNVQSRIAAQAVPQDRFHKLVAPWETLDLAIRLMDGSYRLKKQDHRARELQYRDGLLIALLSIFPVRRRSLACLTLSRHILRHVDGVTILLSECDTKSRRPFSYRVPDSLAPFFIRYIDEIRPRLIETEIGDGLWISYRGRSLSAGRIYECVRRRVVKEFARDMGLHDFRRAAATFIAIEVPEKVGLIPGVLQHASPEVGQRHYNLASSSAAIRRFTELMSQRRKGLRHRGNSVAAKRSA